MSSFDGILRHCADGPAAAVDYRNWLCRNCGWAVDTRETGYQDCWKGYCTHHASKVNIISKISLDFKPWLNLELRGFAIDIMAGFTVLFGSMLQIPLSTTHCKVSKHLIVKVSHWHCGHYALWLIMSVYLGRRGGGGFVDPRSLPGLNLDV